MPAHTTLPHNVNDTDKDKYDILKRGPSQKMLLSIGAVLAAIALIIPNKKNGTAKEVPQAPATKSYTEGTREIHSAIDTDNDAIRETQDLKDAIEDARVRALFDEAENEKKKNEEVLALFQEKIKNDPLYTPTRTERIALTQLGIAVNDGAPIPYKGDGNEE